MRFLHTADWHLGRLFYGERLTEDQSYVLDQLVDVARTEKVQAVLISGDVYDRAVPPPEAVNLLDDVLSRLVLQLNLPVILIAGNHDSPDRLGFGSRLLSQQSLHVAGSLATAAKRITLYDAHGPIDFYAVPYAEPQTAREYLDEEDQSEIHDHDSAMRAVLKRLRPEPASRAVLLAHAFVAGGEESESERPLSVGGSGMVDARCFEGFHYVALGHLHRPQRIMDDRVQYAGSLLKYSASEVTHQKCLNLIDMDEHGRCAVQRIPLRPKRDLRAIQGLFADLMQGSAGGDPNDYLLVTLLDPGPVLDAKARLSALYPKVVHVQPAYLKLGEFAPQAATDFRRVSDRDLFATFFEQASGDPLTATQQSALAQVLEQLEQKRREATA